MPTVRKETSKLYLIFGLLFSALCIVACIFLYDRPGIIGAFFFLILVAIPLAVVGYRGNTNGCGVGPPIKSRDAAMILSFLPFLGHRYLGVPKRGIPMMIPLVTSIGFFFLGALAIIFETGQNGVEVGSSLILYGMLMLVLSWMWSAIDVNDICNKMDLPYEGGFFEMKIKKTHLAQAGLFLTIFLFCILTSLFLLSENWISETHFWISIILSALLPFYVLLDHIRLSKSGHAD